MMIGKKRRQKGRGTRVRSMVVRCRCGKLRCARTQLVAWQPISLELYTSLYMHIISTAQESAWNAVGVLQSLTNRSIDVIISNIKPQSLQLRIPLARLLIPRYTPRMDLGAIDSLSPLSRILSRTPLGQVVQILSIPSTSYRPSSCPSSTTTSRLSQLRITGFRP